MKLTVVERTMSGDISPGGYRFWLRGVISILVAGALVVTGAAVPAAAADPPWMDTSLSADERADLLAAAMTFEEKLQLFTPNGGPILRVDLPPRREIDGPSGVRTTAVDTTAFASGLARAATFNEELSADAGEAMGFETWLTGHNSLAGPVLDVARNPYYGRNFESFGEDPLVIGRMGAANIQGIQRNPVYALVKHYNLNDQETQRFLTHIDETLDERTLQEIYTRPWDIAVNEADPGAIMCAFPQVNGTHACGNRHLLVDILKNQLGFQGWVSSDFNAIVSVQDLNNGLDTGGPVPIVSGDALRQAVLNGTVPMERFDDMVHRILRTFFARGVIDEPAPGTLTVPRPPVTPLPADVLDANNVLAEREATESIVLLRNEDQALPLEEGLGSIAVIGSDADRYIGGGGSAAVPRPARVTTILDGIEERAGAGTDVRFARGTDSPRLGDAPPGLDPVPSAVLTPLFGGAPGEHGVMTQYWRGTGFQGAPFAERIEGQPNLKSGLSHDVANLSAQPGLGGPGLQPLSVQWLANLTPVETGEYTLELGFLGTAKLLLDDTLLIDGRGDLFERETATVNLQAGQSYKVQIVFEGTAPGQYDVVNDQPGSVLRFNWEPPSDAAYPEIQEAVELARNSDAAVVVARTYIGEGADRSTLRLPQAQDRLIRSVAAANPNTIVVLATDAAVAMPWIDDVEAVMEAWFPGQAGGSVANVLFGDHNPSGKLPLTFPLDDQQVAQIGVENGFEDLNVYPALVPHPEGVFMGYRGYDELGLDPQFGFGHGLSYTTFEYQSVTVQDPIARVGDGDDTYQAGMVTVQVQNTGDVAGTEIVQIYHGELPTDRADTPPKQLLGWGRITLEPGATGTVEIPVELYDSSHLLAYRDTEWNDWITPIGETELYVGASSRDIRLTDSITVAEPDTAAPTVTLTADPAEPNGNAGWYLDPVQLTAAATDDTDPAPLVEASIDGAEFAPVTAPIVIDTDGVHTVAVRATDASGNVSAVVEWTGSIDQTAPTVTAQEQNSGRRLALTATDATSGVEAIEYRYQLKVGNRTDYGPWLEYRNPINIAPARILAVEYRATDVAGNVSEVGTHR